MPGTFGAWHLLCLELPLALDAAHGQPALMARAPRQHELGGIYHITTKGLDKKAIFRDDLDHVRFLTLLARVVTRFRWHIFGVCLMTTHYHLIVQLTDLNLAHGMRVVNGDHARNFNARHKRRGALYEARYSDTHVSEQSHLLAAIRYVALNPVEAGIVERPQDWPWSTYAQLIGLQPCWSFFDRKYVLDVFSPNEDSAVRIVRDFVEEQVPGTQGAWHQI